MTILKATQHFQVSEKTIRRWIKSGKVKAELIDGRWHVQSVGHVDEPFDQTALIEQLQTENAHLFSQLSEKDSQLARRDDQITALTEQTAALTKTVDQSQQLLAVQTQTTQQLTDQLSSSRQLIADMQSRSTVWQRLKAVFASA